MQVLQRTANLLTVLWAGDCFVPAVKLILMERCQPCKAALSGNMHGLGMSGEDPVLQTSLWVECGLGGVLTRASSKHSPLDLQHRTEPVSYTGCPLSVH